MSDLISREWLLQKTVYHGEPIGDFGIGQKEAFTCFHMLIDSAPTIDAVPVVRCKDCCYAEESVHNNCVICVEHDKTMNENDYCSYGERKAK